MGRRNFLITIGLFVAVPVAAAWPKIVSFDSAKYAPIGGTLSAYFEVLNQGNTGTITVTYTPAPGTTFKSARPTTYVIAPMAVNCSTPAVGATGSVVCQVTSIRSYSDVRILIVSDVPSSVAAGTALTHSVSASADGAPTVSASATEIAEPMASMSVTSTFPPTFVAGAPIDYTITVRNGGPVDAHNIDVDEVSGNGVAIESVTQVAGPAFSICSAPYNDPFGKCIATFGVGQSATFAIHALPPPDIVGQTSGIGTFVFQLDFGNDGYILADAPPNLGSEVADVSVSSTAASGVAVGDEITYTITAHDSGPSDAPDAVLTWSTPPGTTFVSSDAPCPTPAVGSAGTITCPLSYMNAAFVPDLTAAQDETIHVTVRANAVGTTTATAVVTCPHDPVMTNNSASSTTIVAANQSADLQLTVTPPPFAYAGKDATYAFVVHNLGATIAHDFSLSVDTMNVWIGNCDPTPCPIGTYGSLDPGASYSGTVSFAFRTSGSQTARFALTSSTPDPNPANNTVAVTTMAYPYPPVFTMLPSSIPQTTVIPGGEVSYDLSVFNGESPLTLQVAIDVPTGTPLLSVPASCAPVSPAFAHYGFDEQLCSMPTIDPGGTGDLSFRVRAPSTLGLFTTKFTASYGYDPLGQPTVATVTLNVAPPPPLTADLDAWITTTPLVIPGGTAPLSFGMRNQGPDAASSPQITFTPPAGVVVDAVRPTAPLACAGSPVIVCSAGSLASGAQLSVAAVAHIRAAAGTSLPYTVAASSPTNDSSVLNNAATTTSLVVLPADIAVRIDPQQLSTVAGAALRFSITLENRGTAGADSIAVHGVVGGNLSVTSLSGGDCHTTTEGFDCSIASLAAGSSVRIDASGTAESQSGGGTVSVSATCATPDSDPTNNSATLPITIGTAHHRAAGHD